jgi:hypothetical protein
MRGHWIIGLNAVSDRLSFVSHATHPRDNVTAMSGGFADEVCRNLPLGADPLFMWIPRSCPEMSRGDSRLKIIAPINSAKCLSSVSSRRQRFFMVGASGSLNDHEMSLIFGKDALKRRWYANCDLW